MGSQLGGHHSAVYLGVRGSGRGVSPQGVWGHGRNSGVEKLFLSPFTDAQRTAATGTLGGHGVGMRAVEPHHVCLRTKAHMEHDFYEETAHERSTKCL